MTTEHTPGPWLKIDKEDYAEIQAAFRPSSAAIALVGKPEDASLIAAAPDLLEALEEILKIRSARTVRSARAAIAYATGAA